MKHLINNQTNFVSFINKGYDFSDAANIKVTPLGGDVSTTLPIIGVIADCFVHTFEVAISDNVIPNGTVNMSVVDSQDDTLVETLGKVTGYDEDNPLAYVVIEN